MIRLVYAKNSAPLDGIRNYAEHCCTAIREHTGRSAELELWDRREPPSHYAGDVLLVQYNPFSYGTRGFAPWLIRRLRAVRKEAEPAAVVLVIHEAFVPPRSVRWRLMGAWQRFQLACLGRSCDRIVVSSEAWLEPVQSLVPNVSIDHVPVGSNLSDERSRRSQIRASRGWGPDTLVVGALGGDPAARRRDYLRAALNKLAQVWPDVVFCDLGTAGLQDSGVDPRVASYRPGFQHDRDLASDLAAVDVFMAPFEDGVSARRTTLAAALQQGLAIVGTRGRNTDSYLAEDPRLALTEIGDPDTFADQVLRVATDVHSRNSLRDGARALFEERFDWMVVATRLLAAIDDA